MAFVEDFNGGLQGRLWDLDVSTRDRFSYRLRNDSMVPGDQESIVGTLATQAYLQTPPMVVSASAAAGGAAELRIGKLVLPNHYGVNWFQMHGTPLLNIVYSTDNGRTWATPFSFRYNTWTKDAWSGDSSNNCTGRVELCPVAGSVNATLQLQGGLDIVTLRIEILCEPGISNGTTNPFVVDNLSLSGVTFIGMTDAEPRDDVPLVPYTPYFSSEQCKCALLELGSTGFERGFEALVWYPSETWITTERKRGGNVLPLHGAFMAVGGDESVPYAQAVLISRVLYAGPGASISVYVNLGGGGFCWPLAVGDLRSHDAWGLSWRSLKEGDSRELVPLKISGGRDPQYNRQGWVKVWVDLPFEDWTYFQLALTHLSYGAVGDGCASVLLVDTMRFNDVFLLVTIADWEAFKRSRQDVPPAQTTQTPMPHSPPHASSGDLSPTPAGAWPPPSRPSALPTPMPAGGRGGVPAPPLFRRALPPPVGLALGGVSTWRPTDTADAFNGAAMAIADRGFKVELVNFTMDCEDTLAAHLQAFVDEHKPAAIIGAFCGSYDGSRPRDTITRLQVPVISITSDALPDTNGGPYIWRSYLTIRMKMKSLMSGVYARYRNIAFVYDSVYSDWTDSAVASYQAAAGASGITVTATRHEYDRRTMDVAAVIAQALADKPDALFICVLTSQPKEDQAFIEAARAADPKLPLLMPNLYVWDETEQAMAVTGIDGRTTYPLLGGCEPA
ncbi:hypothetical protein HXX76_011593 [Chlamydomonas incerta]|uniref:Leucine-binding protein domain-containing protein n=1 Tax=Chlamydomonas incerta TaxID=51695 RepID=A0A835SX78_CHLIN|nr:hypothetical protein HXX76_011593 [Chlamydomonas incerta]|eukprot:KAG2428475.1 hypothetical protein HXX76_011593 [Chlamydomonas incerta]